MAAASLVERAVDFIDCELEIIKMKMEYPLYFVQSDKKPEPLAQWNGTISELLELALSIHCAGKLLKPSGEPMAFSDVIGYVKNVHGIDVAKPYDRKKKLLVREKGGAPFLDRLKAIFLGEIKKVYE